MIPPGTPPEVGMDYLELAEHLFPNALTSHVYEAFWQ